MGLSLAASIQHVPAEPQQTEISSLLKPSQTQFAVETELKLLLPMEHFQSAVSGIRPFTIIQSYLPKGISRRLVEDLYPDGSANGIFSYARIRETRFSNNRSIYELEFKSKKRETGGLKISRIVPCAPFRLTREAFEELGRLANKGTVVKDRYLRHGIIEHPEGPISVRAEIDLFRAGGRPLSDFRPGFATVDIEIPREDLLRPLLEGKHSLSFLKSCILLSSLERNTAKAISNRRLARDGLGKKHSRQLSSAVLLSD